MPKNENDWRDTILWDILNRHFGHTVCIVRYGGDDIPEDVCLECEDCCEVLIDAGIYTIRARDDL